MRGRVLGKRALVACAVWGALFVCPTLIRAQDTGRQTAPAAQVANPPIDPAAFGALIRQL